MKSKEVAEEDVEEHVSGRYLIKEMWQLTGSGSDDSGQGSVSSLSG